MGEIGESVAESEKPCQRKAEKRRRKEEEMDICCSMTPEKPG